MNLEEEIFFLPYKDSSEKGRSKEGNTHAHTHRRNIMNTLGHCFTKLEVEFSLLRSGCLTYLIQKDEEEKAFLSTKEINDLQFQVLVSLWITKLLGSQPWEVSLKKSAKSALRRSSVETARNFLLSNTKCIGWLISPAKKTWITHRIHFTNPKYPTVSDSTALKTVSGTIQGNSSMSFMPLVTFLSAFGKTLILLFFNRRAACIPGPSSGNMTLVNPFLCFKSSSSS